MKTFLEFSRWLGYLLLGILADVLEMVLSAFALNSRPAADSLTSDVDGLSDEEILQLVDKATMIPDENIIQLTPRTVAKVSQDFEEDAANASEADSLNEVFSKTTIPVPRVRRIIKGESDYLMVMDYIEGRTLAQVWSTFPLWKKICVAYTLRRYVRQLRRVTASPTTPPGPLSTHGPRVCESPIFGRYQSHRGPFVSYADLSNYFNEKRDMVLDIRKVPADDPSRKDLFDDSSPLVLTHQDLNPRNIIQGLDGRLWIIDWAWAGYYPPWFEYVAMQRQTENERGHRFKDRFWDLMVPFVCGPYFRQERWLAKMGHGLELYLRGLR